MNKTRSKNSNVLRISLNWNTSLIDGAKFLTFDRLVVGCHLEGTMSQISYLGPSSYFMKSRKFRCKI